MRIYNSDEYEYIEKFINNQDRRYRRQQQQRYVRPQDQMAGRSQFTDFNDNAEDFVPSYAASLDPLHFERQWLIRSVGSFYRDNIITDVTRIVKGGKESNVYCCLATPATGVDLIAAKLYRPRTLRHLRNDAMYKEGRLLLNHDGKEAKGDREARAIRKKTRFGQNLDFANWIMHEFQVHQELFSAGADVPKPIARRGNTILMDFIGDEWAPAPTLNDVALEPEEAQPLFDRVMKNIRLMLSRHYVHGDLSPYNILYWNGQITIIDFPQLVDARANNNTLMLLERDIKRVYEYFARNGVAADPAALTTDLWQEYQSSEL